MKHNPVTNIPVAAATSLVAAVLASAVAGRIDLSRPKLNKKGNTKP